MNIRETRRKRRRERLSETPPQSESSSVGRRVALGASAFVTANIVSQGLSFVILPVLARYIAPSEYGLVAIATAAAGVAGVVFGVGLETPVFRSWFEYAERPDARADRLRTARSLLAASTVVGFAAAVVLVLLLRNGAAWEPHMVLLAIGGAIGQSFVASYALPLLRAQDRLARYVQIQVAIAVSRAVLLILFVLFIRWEATGWILAVAIAQWVGLLLASRSVGRMNLGFDREHGMSLLRLGGPLVPHALAHWSLAAADRLVLAAFLPLGAVGIYGMVYAASAVVGTLLTELSRALMNEYGRLVHYRSEDDRRRALDALAAVQVIAAVGVGYVAVMLGPTLFRWLFDDRYSAGVEIIPWVVLGYVLFGMYFVPIIRLTVVDGRSGIVAVATILGALANLGANFALIPVNGMLGAAQATALGYAVMLVLVYTYANRRARHPVNIPLRRLAPVGMLLSLLGASVELAQRAFQHLDVPLAVAAAATAVAMCLSFARSQLASLPPVHHDVGTSRSAT